MKEDIFPYKQTGRSSLQLEGILFNFYQKTPHLDAMLEKLKGLKGLQEPSYNEHAHN